MDLGVQGQGDGAIVDEVGDTGESSLETAVAMDLFHRQRDPSKLGVGGRREYTSRGGEIVGVHWRGISNRIEGILCSAST